MILLCEDWVKMRAFYHDTLAFPVYREWDGWCELRIGSVLLTLRHRGREYDGAAADGAGVQLAFRVAPDEVEPCWRQLVASGVDILEPPDDHGSGHRTLFFRDPEQNILEIYADIEPRSDARSLSGGD